MTCMAPSFSLGRTLRAQGSGSQVPIHIEATVRCLIERLLMISYSAIRLSVKQRVAWMEPFDPSTVLRTGSAESRSLVLSSCPQLPLCFSRATSLRHFHSPATVSRLLQHLGPTFLEWDKVENLHFPGAKLPRLSHLLILIVQPACANHALFPLHAPVLEATGPSGPSIAKPLNHMVGKERPDPQRPGAGIKRPDGITSLVYAPAQAAKIDLPVLGKQLPHAFRVLLFNTSSIGVGELLDQLAVPQLFDSFADQVVHTLL